MPGKTRLRVIGSTALMMQAEYLRGTKDGDVLETDNIDPAMKAELLGLAGKGTRLAQKHQIYLDIVSRSILMLPQEPRFHPLPGISARLVHFEIEALDIVDVAISKLKPYRPSDAADIQAMADLGHIDPDQFKERFLSAIDCFADGSTGAEKLPTIVANFHEVQREYLFVDETAIDLPGWIDEG